MTAPRFHLFSSAPAPVAPYSHAVESDGWIFLTGQIPTDPDDDHAPLPEGIAAQTRQVMDNLIVVLGNLGLGLEHVLQARAYLTPMLSVESSDHFPPDSGTILGRSGLITLG